MPAGPAGNISAGEIYGPCCRLNVSAANGPFSGGQDARSYPMVTAQDVNEATAPVNLWFLSAVRLRPVAVSRGSLSLMLRRAVAGLPSVPPLGLLGQLALAA